MADKILKSITFPNLPDKYIIPETTVDSVPTQGSTNAVSSGGVFSALEDKSDKDSTPENLIFNRSVSLKDGFKKK